MTKGVEGSDTGAEERSRLGETDSVGDCGEPLGGGDEVFGVATVVDDARNLGALTCGEFPPATGLANGTMTAEPADTDTPSHGPVLDPIPEGIDDAGDFVARDARVGEPREQALFCYGVAMADSAGFDFHADLAGAGIGQRDARLLQSGLWPR